jgi:hypothetical protein
VNAFRVADPPPIEVGMLVRRRFESFTEDFLTWALFYGPEGEEKGTADSRA